MNDNKFSMFSTHDVTSLNPQLLEPNKKTFDLHTNLEIEKIVETNWNNGTPP
jgi:hypothetical protein